MDILFLKKIYDEDKGNTKVVRRALNSISKSGINLFERVALFDFDLSINYEHAHQKNVCVPPPDTSTPQRAGKGS
ncbi:hypothetical protein Hanom_Chr16g01426271 [Helianthus anomalus]